MEDIKELKRQIADLKKKEKDISTTEKLKKELRMYKKRVNAYEFDKKHKVLGAIGKTSGKVKTSLVRISKKMGSPLTPAQQKSAERNKKKLNELLKMY